MLRRNFIAEGKDKPCPYSGNITVVVDSALGLGDDKPALSCII